MREIEDIPDALLVDADQVLCSHLSAMTYEAYAREYVHWRGDPPRIVDPHPNKLAHSLIAQALSNAIRGTDKN